VSLHAYLDTQVVADTCRRLAEWAARTRQRRQSKTEPDLGNVREESQPG
jgi:hypothetical protein